MKTLIQWLAKIFKANIKETIYITKEVEKQISLEGEIKGNVTIKGNLIVEGYLDVTGEVTAYKINNK